MESGTPRHRYLRAMRLVKKRDFQRVYREGSRARGDLMTVAVAPNGLEHPRLGLSIGKVVWKHAVRRNRVRRVFREAFRLSIEQLPVGMDLVLIGSRPRVQPELEATRRELVHLANKASRRYGERQAEARRPGQEDGP